MTRSQTSAAVKGLDQLYEFDREPVTNDKLLGPGYFAGSFSGEHVAATEFVIGVMFVNWGASVQDVFVGLAIGNVLAVLTWTFICAPIAVDTRLTLYWYLRRIGGPFMTVIYNVLNAILFCILAGCMITVAASAVRIPFNIPAQTDWYPNDLRFVLVVLAVGAVVVALAILGFKKLAAFSAVCSPWMFLMFVSGAVAMLPLLANAAHVGPIRSVDQFLEMGRNVVWTGRTPDGSPPMGFWKVAAFAWICNLAMHGGLSDMALFRYARRASYGLFSAFGMFLGHYLAWICAGMMGVGAALLLSRPLPELDAGEVGYQTLGWAGAIAVIIAGWTTSNPTLYRAGLAFQAITPNWSRAKVTLVTGLVTTIIACFPFVFTKLLDFVGIYGLLLAPAGAIVVTEHWVFRRIGLTRYWASRRGHSLNAPALTAWIVSIVFALVTEKKLLLALAGAALPAAAVDGITQALDRVITIDLFFLFLPVYILTSVLYIVLASLSGAREAVAHAEAEPPAAAAPLAAATTEPGSAGGERTVPWVSGLVALAALVACLVMPMGVFLGGNDRYEAHLAAFRTWLMLPTVVYFVAGTIFYYRWCQGRITV